MNDKGASNSQGPDSYLKHQWELRLLKESQVDTWRLQGLVN